MKTSGTSRSSHQEHGISLIELLVGMAITIIIATGATVVLTSFYSGSHSAQQLANRVATASMLTSVMDHTLGLQGYYDAATSSVAPIPAENPAPASQSIGPVKSVTVNWLPTGATASPYCQGTLATARGGMNWSVSGPAGCLPASAVDSAVFYPVGEGWEFYLVPDTDCNDNQVQQMATAVVASNASSGTEAVTCLSNQ